MSLRKQVLHYADLDYDANEISRLLHVDRRLVSKSKPTATTPNQPRQRKENSQR